MVLIKRKPFNQYLPRWQSFLYMKLHKNNIQISACIKGFEMWIFAIYKKVIFSNTRSWQWTEYTVHTLVKWPFIKIIYYK